MAEKELFGNSEQLESGHGKDHVADPGKMVGDLISRQAALDSLGKDPMGGLNYESILGSLPSAQPEKCEDCGNFNKTMLLIPQPKQQWIPCSERLPKVREWVLCQCRAGIMDVLRLTEDGSWNKNYPHAEYMSGFVIAWCPLPEPWKGDAP